MKGLLVSIALLGLNGTLWAQDLSLTCDGAGSITSTQVSVGQDYSYESHKFEKSTSSSTTGRRTFSGTASVELSNGTVRLKLPKEIVPALSGGRDAWYALQNAFVGDKEITGELSLNMFNHPSVRIDRMTGKLFVSGKFSDFTALCAAVDQAAGPKF